jgi:deazaflavin-dependent oxidoreductase (nitroreductase family)
MADSRPNATLRCLLRVPALLYRGRCGWLLGHRFLLLIHVGRRSGLRRRTVLEVVAYQPDGPELIVMSGFGRAADWFRNIQAAPEPEVIAGTRQFKASCRVLDTAEAACVFAVYEHRHRWLAPILRAVLSRLVGWRYSGSHADRRRLVTQLPLIAFRPRPSPRRCTPERDDF